ncbi:unnamed protein product [Phytomonas sp. Hart1]|nr:unnamed protein product [Phytomonas sp. Hart1]|eukprot:CCW67844.1 unnamed protein product [Phytomonas sp. isolate Hart1]
MLVFNRTFVLLRPFRQVAFAKRSSAGGINHNKGALSPSERGDPFTEPMVYRNRKNITAQIKTSKKEKFLLRQDLHNSLMNSVNIDIHKEEQLRSGHSIPLTPDEVKASRAMDEAEVVHGMNTLDADYTTQVQLLMKREAERRDHVLDKFGQAPTSREFYKLFQSLRAADDAEEVEKYQKRLVEENGIYPLTRIDAFMLDDDGYFPEWVQDLPYTIRDRVKYGSLGLTEEDEALRIHLGRLPRDKRLKEWDRLKAAKMYRAAHEETLTMAELRDARQGKRRFHWLQRKRQKRAAKLRRMALRKPDGYEEWPSSAVDYSQRIAFIAQHVENGLQTGGQWPLDPELLLRAKIERKQKASERMFLMSPDEKKVAKKSFINPGIQELLASFDAHEKPFKRLSRKTYANRVNAVVHGDQDEHGRKYRRMHALATRRTRPYESVSEIGLEKEVRNEPRVNVSGLNHADDEHWTKHYKSWRDGLPSIRYGS